MRQIARHAIRATALALPIAFAAPAAAGEDKDGALSSALLLSHQTEHESTRNFELPALERLGLATSSKGIVYKRALSLGRRDVVLKLHGPVQSRGFGLGFVIKF